MKTKRKKLTNFLKLGILFFGISLLLFNCEKDEYQEEGINGVNQKILSKKISFDKIPNINTIKNSLDKIHSKNSKKTLSKSNNNLGEFIILKNEVLLMEYSETHTYTFKIIREKPEYYIENIVLHYNLETENYDEYLVQYNVNKNEYLGIINGKYINESTQIKITKLDTGTITLSGKSNCSRTCQTISLRCTAGRRHEFGDPECCVNKGSCSPLYAATVYQSCTTKCTDILSDGSNEGLASTGGGGSTGVATNPLPAEPCFEGFSGETDENGVSVCNSLEEEELLGLDEQIFIDQNFKDNECLKSVYDQMGKATKFKEYLQNFEAEFSVADLRFTTDDNFSVNEDADYHNAMAITKPPLANNEIKIKFNTDPNTTGNILNKPDVFKAVSMIHEIIHAEMYRKMLDAVRAAEINQTSLNWRDWPNNTDFEDFIESLQNKYEGIFDYYTRYDWDTSTPNNAQHQAMASHYRNIVKQALTDYDPTLTDEQKEALSWIGLNEANIVAWQNLTPNERTAINSLQTQINNTSPNGCN
jgi:hypothetical protein